MFNCYYNGQALSVYKNKELMILLNQTCPCMVYKRERGCGHEGLL